MTTTLHIEDVTSPNKYAYLCHMQRGGVKAIASARQSMTRKGAYEMSTSAFNATCNRPLGSKQQQVAADLTVCGRLVEREDHLGRQRSHPLVAEAITGKRGHGHAHLRTNELADI